MKRTLALVLVALFATSTVSADINLGTLFTWGAAPGAASYRVRVLDSLNNPVAISDPATHDPDGNGFFDTTSLQAAASIWLVGKPLGLYKFKVSPVDANGNIGTEVGINDTYTAPAIDPATLSFVNP